MNKHDSSALLNGVPTVEQVDDPASLWHVPVEFRADYLIAAAAMDRRQIREVEGLVEAGLAGNRSISSSWLLGLRAEARAAAGLPMIDVERVSGFRVTQQWPEELSGAEGVTCWALHQRCVEFAVDAVKSREFSEALNASMGRACCPVCSVSVNGPASDLCGSCSDVLSFITMEKARELAAVKVGGKTRERLVSDWLAQSG